MITQGTPGIMRPPLLRTKKLDINLFWEAAHKNVWQHYNTYVNRFGNGLSGNGLSDLTTTESKNAPRRTKVKCIDTYSGIVVGPSRHFWQKPLYV